MKVPKPVKLPSGNYRIRLRLGGEEQPITRPTAKECIRAAELIKAEYKAGKLKAKTPGGITFEAAAAEFIQAKSALSPATIRGYKTIERTWFQNVKKHSIGEIDWQAEINKVIAAGKSPKTVDNVWGFAKAVLRFKDCPVPKVTLPAPVKNTRPWLDFDEILELLKVIRGKPYEAAILLAIHSLRRSEILSMTYEQISKGVIHVRGATVQGADEKFVHKDSNKTYNSTRDIPVMIPRLSELALGKTGPVYPYHANSIHKQVRRACQDAGITEVTTHGLRHSFASIAFSDEVGMSEQEVMELGGWSDPTVMHQIYVHIQQKDRLKHKNKMAELFEKNQAV